MKSVDKRLNEIDVKLARLEVLLTNHLRHSEKHLYILASALASGTVGYLVSLLK